MGKNNPPALNVFQLNAISLDSVILNGNKLSFSSDRPSGYGVDNWLWDDGQTMFWDHGGVVLTDK